MNESQLPASTRIIYAAFDFVGKYWRRLVVCSIAILGLLYISTGIYIVKKEEQGIVTRFGKIVNAEVMPGVGYAIPLIEKIHIFPVKRIISKHISSNKSGTENFTVLSGDTNLLEVTMTLQYTVTDLRKYLFVVAEPEVLLARLARENLIEEFGNNFVELIFTNNRKHIEDSLEQALQIRFEELGLGIDINALSLVDLGPVEETVSAFRDVSDAVAEKLQMESEAQRKRERRLARSRGQAQAIILDAEAKANTRRQQAASTAKIFLDLLAEYRENPEQVAVTRYWDRMRTIFQDARLTSINSATESAVNINLVDSFAPPFSIPADFDTTTPTVVPPLDVAERSVATMPPKISSEHSEGDTVTMDGRTHTTTAELDHMSTANSRSLIVDSSSLFGHAHVGRRDQILEKLSVELPITENKKNTTLETTNENDE